VKKQRKSQKTKWSGPVTKQLTKNSIAEIVKQVTDLAEPLCVTEGLELVHVEFRSEPSGRILRLYIDRPGGVTLNDCADISHQIGDLLDVYLKSPGAYNLEVSSPGSDRPLAKLIDFERFKGNIARIRISQPIDGQKNFKGTLSGISEGLVKLLVDDNTVAIPFREIIKAQLVNYGER
jgi:ribosome maturation factor RimP